jgi:hypothetical protein
MGREMAPIMRGEGIVLRENIPLDRNQFCGPPLGIPVIMAAAAYGTH